jgi:hypothetical protein
MEKLLAAHPELDPGAADGESSQQVAAPEGGR